MKPVTLNRPTWLVGKEPYDEEKPDCSGLASVVTGHGRERSKRRWEAQGCWTNGKPAQSRGGFSPRRGGTHRFRRHRVHTGLAPSHSPCGANGPRVLDRSRNLVSRIMRRLAGQDHLRGRRRWLRVRG